MKYLALALLLLAGCSSITGSKVLPDGSKIEVKSTRWFWHSQGIAFKVTDTNGVAAELAVGLSKSDSDSIKSMSEGIAYGVAKAFKSGL